MFSWLILLNCSSSLFPPSFFSLALCIHNFPSQFFLLCCERSLLFPHFRSGFFVSPFEIAHRRREKENLLWITKIKARYDYDHLPKPLWQYWTALKKNCVLFFCTFVNVIVIQFLSVFLCCQVRYQSEFISFSNKTQSEQNATKQRAKKNRTIWRKTVCYLLSYAVFIFACAHWILASNEPEKSSDTTGYTNKNCMAIAEKWTDRQQQQQQKKENKRIYCHYMWLLLRCEWTHRTGASHIINQPAQRNTKSI